ncbi:hypothetical protein LguiA_019706 [Lonicera macranthoides]
MGSCVSSAHRNSKSVSMKFKLMSFGSKSDKVLIPSPPLKDKPVEKINGHNQISDFGSKEETFFDSQAWLDSDCDEDFLSVNGDFTPSHGSSPVHHNFSSRTPWVNKPILVDQTVSPKPEPSQTDSKKKLSDLFKESLRSNSEVDDRSSFSNQNGSDRKMGTDPSTLGTPSYASATNSVCSSERTPNGDFKYRKEKPVRSAQCCLPSLLSSRSFNERKKKMSSPVTSVG